MVRRTTLAITITGYALCVLVIYHATKGNVWFKEVSVSVLSEIRTTQNETVNCSVISNKHSFILWDILKSDWFDIYGNKNLPKVHDNNYNNKLGTIALHPTNVKGLIRNHRQSYRNIAFFYTDNITRFYSALNESIFNTHDNINNYATFNNVAVTTEGHIISKYTCKVAKSGGCLSSKQYKTYSATLQSYDSIFSLSVYWGYGIWHFPMEALVGLQAIENMMSKNSKMHITKKTKYTLSWLELVGIDSRNIITNDVFAKHLIVPEMGRCGNPSLHQVQWLRRSLKIKFSSNRNKLILIKRTKKRKMIDFELIQNFTQGFARSKGLEMVVHDDSKLPSLYQQLKLFREAKIVIGPHGAGFVNLISTEPETCVIEFLSTDPNICYMRLSYVLGLKYVSIPLYDNRRIDLSDLQNAASSCLNQIKI